jgi:Flp pilus assembly protein TadD
LPTIRLLLFIDRFEAVFRLPHVTDAERAVFINVLDQLARSGTMQLVLGCRNDFYPHLASYPALMNLKLSGGHFDLTPPGSADISQIVRHPAQVAQLRYTVDERGEGLDEVLCNAARSGPDSLPLLQYCLQELYRQRTADGELTHAAFHAMGGLEGAIGARAEQVISALGSAQIAALPHVLSQLVLVAEDESTVSSRRVPWSALRSDAENKLVQALVDAHLFVSDLQGGAPTFGIAHEALLRRWPRVVEWVEEHRQALQIRSRISAQANRWQESGRKRDMLLPSGTQTNQAREILRQGGVSISAQDQEFIHSSLKSERRSERIRLSIMIVMACLVVLVGGLGLTARTAQTLAEQRRAEAEDLMGYMLGEFVEKLRPLGKLDLLDSISNRALAYLSENNQKDSSDEALMQRVKSLQLIGEVKIARADPTGASTALLAGRDILHNRLIATPDDAALLKSAGENAFWLGKIHLDRKELDRARNYFEEYRNHADKRATLIPSDIDALTEQSYAHNTLGTLALRLGNVEDAAREFAISVEMKTKALQRLPSDEKLTATLADSLSWLASAKLQLGQLSEAESLSAQELSLIKRLHEANSTDIRWFKPLASAWLHQAEVSQALGNTVLTAESLRNALSILETIVEKDPTNRTWQRTLYITELRLFDFNEKTLGKNEALTILDKLHSSLQALGSLDPKKLNVQMLLAGVEHRKAAIQLQQGKAKIADDLLNPALQHLQKTYTAAPTDERIRSFLLDALLLKADINFALNDHTTAESHCIEAQNILKPLVKRSADFRLLAPWVKSAACLNNNEQAYTARKQLELMNYRDPFYLQYLLNHPTRKANL